MATIKVNFADTQEFKPLPAGSYLLRITDAEVKEAGENAKNPGSEYIKFEFTVVGGEYDGRKVFANASLLPNALFFLKGMLKALGRVEEGEDDLDFELEELLGEEVVGVLTIRKSEEYGDQNNVKRFKPADDWAGDSGLQ